MSTGLLRVVRDVKDLFSKKLWNIASVVSKRLGKTGIHRMYDPVVHPV